jgi:carnitine O-acetyltransferase
MLPRNIPPPSSGGPKTFSLDSTLPKLPLPPLQDTLNQYYQVALVFCQTEQEIQELKQNMNDALQSKDLKQIQSLLEKRHALTEHYVDEWWTKYAYLEDRDPIVPQESAVFKFSSSGSSGGAGGGSSSSTNNISDLPTDVIPQCIRAALIAYASSIIHVSLCDESFPVVGPSINKPYAMDQFRHIYETCRIPQKDMDKQIFYFQPDSDRVKQLANNTTKPRHRTIIIGSNGRFYEIALDSTLTGKPLSVGALWAKIVSAQLHSETFPITRNEITHVGFFTGGNRNEWAEFRSQLIQENSRNNVHVLESIQRSLLIISLQNSPLSNEVLLAEVSMSKEAGSRWYDKSTQYIVYRNGMAGCSMEHSVMDAAGQFLLHAEMERMMTKWFQETSIKYDSYEARLRQEANSLEARRETDLVFLPFLASNSDQCEKLQQRIHIFQQEYLQRRSSVWQIQTVRFQGVGKRILKRLNVSPDSFLQVAFQTTYYHIHHRIPSTYETVGMLPFRLGRTEAGRSATMASRILCEALHPTQSSSTSNSDQLSTLAYQACEAHSHYVRNCAQGKGIDRHIFAIKCQARESGLTIPKLFTNELFQRASKWDLSTSHSFVELLHGEKGGTSFRPFALDMTGVVYGIFDEWIDVTVITCTPPQYDTTQFLTTLSVKIAKLYTLLESRRRAREGLL